MSGPAVEATQGVVTRDRSVASPSPESCEGEEPARIVKVTVLEARATARKRRPGGKPEFILHAEKWR